MFTDKVQLFAGKIGNQRHLIALRNSISSSMPLIIIGSVFMLISNFPIKTFTDWLSDVGITMFLNKASNATFGIIGLTVTFGNAYYLAKHYKKDALSAGLISLGAFSLLTPVFSTVNGNGFPARYLGSSGVVVGILVALISTEMFKFLLDKNLVIKMPGIVPPNVSRSFSDIIPGLLIITFWLLIIMGLHFIGIDNIHSLITDNVSKPLSVFTKTLPGILIIIFIQCFFWMFGIHGSQITGPVLEALLLQNSDANRLAFQSGKELPNIITYEFLYNFVFSGGAGCVFALAILTFFLSKSKENKKLGKLSLVPVSFQVAEPILFGFPIILNIRMLIPFVLCPVLTAIITYYAMDFNWVAKPAGGVIPWTTPPIIAGYLASGNKISGAVIQIITITVNLLIYYPFFKIDDYQKVKREQESNH